MVNSHTILNEFIQTEKFTYQNAYKMYGSIQIQGKTKQATTLLKLIYFFLMFLFGFNVKSLEYCTAVSYKFGPS